MKLNQIAIVLPINNKFRRKLLHHLKRSLSFLFLSQILCIPAFAQSPFTPADRDRADTLLKQMTTDEKIGQLNQTD